MDDSQFQYGIGEFFTPAQKLNTHVFVPVRHHVAWLP